MMLAKEQSNVLDHVAENEAWVYTKDKCKGQVIVVEPVQVGVVTLPLFDRDVRSILNISASDLIEKYEKDIGTESVNVVVSDFNSHDTIGFKDFASFVADYTPIFTFPKSVSMSPSTNHDTTGLLSPPSNEKCKLVDVYNLDDTDCESSTKPSTKSIGVKESVLSTQLLIPKVEK
ncbi:unnamed protein product [Lactuca virosa]|uniref:Uncharacterized protein n=1 Tax=Lactuca virosa TaxID=75947 RepID=A0AAU9MK56_9ASTR|nr:unnamed protein product [Lactuca virosa]